MKITERRVQIGVHNGRTFFHSPQRLVLHPGDLYLYSKGSFTLDVVQNVCFAVIIQFDYIGILLLLLFLSSFFFFLVLWIEAMIQVRMDVPKEILATMTQRATYVDREIPLGHCIFIPFDSKQYREGDFSLLMETGPMKSLIDHKYVFNSSAICSRSSFHSRTSSTDSNVAVQ